MLFRPFPDIPGHNPYPFHSDQPERNFDHLIDGFLNTPGYCGFYIQFFRHIIDPVHFTFGSKSPLCPSYPDKVFVCQYLRMFHHRITDMIDVPFLPVNHHVVHIVMLAILGREKSKIEYAYLHTCRNSLFKVPVQGIHWFLHIAEFFDHRGINSQVFHRTAKYCIRQVAERHHRGKHQLDERKVAEINSRSNAKSHGFRQFHTIKVKQVGRGAAFAMACLAVCIIYH